MRRTPRSTRTYTLLPYTTLFRSGEGRAEEALDLARARHGLLVFLAQLVHAQDRDDVLELLVLLQGLLDAAGGVVMLVADHVRIHHPRGRVQRVHGRIDAERGDRKSTRLNSSH